VKTDPDLLEQLYPTIEWRSPVRIARTDGVERWCCRICIAQKGLRALDLERVGFETSWEAVQHIELEHGRQ
jgi:hypothetical protein